MRELVASQRTQTLEIQESCGPEIASRTQKTCVIGNPDNISYEYLLTVNRLLKSVYLTKVFDIQERKK